MCIRDRYDLLKGLIHVRHGDIFPIIPLAKLFDPFSLLMSFLWEYSLEHRIPLPELEIQLIKMSASHVPTSQPTLGGIYISGFRLRGGKLSDGTILVNEDSREYEYVMPAFLMRVAQKKTKKAINIKWRPSLSIYIVNPTVQTLEFNVEEEFELHIQDYLLSPSFTNQGREAKGKMATIVSRKSVKASHYIVRLPVVNPSNKQPQFTLFDLPVYFYMMSFHPQHHWQKKCTAVYLQADKY
eukprot:TRINITY_DN10884_c0_g1_i2.p1 TRINITY_DN10884_c0_g1~~TRINITY_DN10884_c0_g1_i2.p1  ORF type:complete len:260 (-),score=67.38 TRINITY_DN10884_c0_g1_i2:3-722(-)